MPSEELLRAAHAALAERREPYHSAVAAAVDEVRALLESHRAPVDGRQGARAAAELGVFAAGRIDAARFESLFSERPTLDPDAIARIQAALEALTAIVTAGDALHQVKVPAGGNLVGTVRRALAVAGRAFGAGRAVEQARAGTGSMPYAPGFDALAWNRAERTVAPPLVVDVDGADLRPAGLVDLLEERQAIVLLVRKPAPPAALARLISPDTLVIQTRDASGLHGLGSWYGPAIAAVIPDAISFRYQPEQDGLGALTVDAATLPADRLRPVGGLSVARQESDLALLKLLDGAAAGRVVAAAHAETAAATDPTDRLAAWLLRQATIPEPGEV